MRKIHGWIGSILALVAAVSMAGCSLCACRKAADKPLVIAEGGKSAYRIVIAHDAPPPTLYGARELRQFLAEMTGADLPIVRDSKPATGREIVLGDSARLRSLGVDIDFDKLGKEGYVIRRVGKRLVIAGGEPRGTLYGVYGLLEDHLGCRWFAPGCSRIPQTERLEIGEIDDTQIPELEYREPFVLECFDGDWCARNRVNSSWASLEAKHGGKVKFGEGFFVHTFDTLVSPDRYFDAHPEYFSLINGKRLKGQSQLCCTNEDVVRLCTEGVLKAMREQPDAFVFDVSQNDWGNYCQCDKCQELAKAEDSQMAPVLQLVNAVAEAAEKEFPDRAIETLAYQWTRQAPKTMRPRPNVIVRLCSIECCFSHPLATCDSPQNQAFRQDAEAWAKVCDRLWVWDYVTSFRHYLVPFPNQRVRDDNIRFFIQNNVTGIFEQDCYNSLRSELAELGGYLTAKMLWNPDYNEDVAINEFLDGFYGPQAALPIRRYIDLIHDKVEKDNIHLGIWAGPEGAHLTDALLAEADALWAQAEAAASDQPERLRRVRISRMSVDYAILERALTNATFGLDFDHQNFSLKPKTSDVFARLDRFMGVIQSSGLKRIAEWSDVDFKAYRKRFTDSLASEKRLDVRPALKVDGLVPGLAYRYFEGDWLALPALDSIAPKAQGTVADLDISSCQRQENFAFVFDGYIQAPRDGVYAFELGSDDGSRLLIDGEVAIDHDGPHSYTLKPGYVALRAGLHAIQVQYFEIAADQELTLHWMGPEIEREKVPAGAYFRKP